MIVHEKIQIDNYDEIVLNVHADVFYQQISQDKPFLQISVDENILPSIDIHVKNNRLIISQNNDSVLKPSQFKIYTNSRSISKVKIISSGNFYMEKEVNAGNMEIHISGAGDVKTDSLYCKDLKLTISGAGDMEIKGAANHAEFHISGSGNINAFDYLINKLDCSINGSGDINAFVSENLNASISGSGDLKYKGNPEKVTSHVSGSGSIHKIN
ncbi:MAG: DUF2807 domain-containing protein [Dysgonamonadaceae bacterium]|jgi:hypothetical protein|nr:DUF2807 domain-containing protein [Dysgonamonadaceae bacterium]